MKTENNTSKKLMLEATKVIADILGNKAVMGECYTNTTTCFILGDNLYKTPIEIHISDDKTYFNVLFFDTLDAKNWSMTMRKPMKGYFTHEGHFYTVCEDNEDMAIRVSKKEVLDNIKLACKQYMDFSTIEKLLDETDVAVFAAMKLR